MCWRAVRMCKTLSYFLTPCVPDSTRIQVSDLTDPALSQSEAEPIESKHVQIAEQDYSCKSGLATWLNQQPQSSRELPDYLLRLWRSRRCLMKSLFWLKPPLPPNATPTKKSQQVNIEMKEAHRKWWEINKILLRRLQTMSLVQCGFYTC